MSIQTNMNISTWTTAEVVEWVRSLGLEDVAVLFESVGITGLDLEHIELLDLMSDLETEVANELWNALQNLLKTSRQAQNELKRRHATSPFHSNKKSKTQIEIENELKRKKAISPFPSNKKSKMSAKTPEQIELTNGKIFTKEMRLNAMSTKQHKFVEFSIPVPNQSNEFQICQVVSDENEKMIQVFNEKGEEKNYPRSLYFNIYKKSRRDILTLQTEICPVKLLAPYYDNVDRSSLITRSFELSLPVLKMNSLNKKSAVKGILRAWAIGTDLRSDLTDIFLIEEVVQMILNFLPEVRPDLYVNKEGTTMYSSTGSFCLDAFTNVVPTRNRGDTKGGHIPEKPEKWNTLFTNAWNEHPLTTLRIMLHLGGVRVGKSDNYNFYHALIWLYRNQPATLIANLHLLPEISYYKSLLELCARIVDDDERSYERDCAMQNKIRSEKKENYLVLEKIPKAILAQKALNRFDHDVAYRVLHTRVAQIFAEALKKDENELNKNKKRAKISLAAKWCPSSGSSYDKRTLMFESIAREIYPKFVNETDIIYAKRCQKHLRQLLKKLRTHLRICEKYMSERKWNEIKYENVPGICMKLRKLNFENHDPLGFRKYLAAVESGKKEIKARVVLPDAIMKDATQGDETTRRVAELQWKSLVNKLKAEQNEILLNTACVLDPCKPASVALAILFAQLNEGYFQGKVFDFTPQPMEFSLLQNATLYEQQNHLSRIGCSTLSVEGLLKEVLKTGARQMYVPSRIFIFTCMNFTTCGGDRVDWEKWERLFFEAGYTIPQIVHWNTQAQRGAPIVKTEKHSCVISGFSPNLLKGLLKSGSLDPIDMMFEQLNHPILKQCTVIDSNEEAKQLFEAILMEELDLNQFGIKETGI